MKVIAVIAARVAGGAKLSASALGICLPLVVAMVFVSAAGFFEAEKEYERKKAAGESVPSSLGLSWISLMNVLPPTRKRAYFIFLGACFAVIFATVLIDEVLR